MFSRVPSQKDYSNDYSHNFFRRYNSMCDLYTVINGARTLRLKDAQVFFTTEHKTFDFSIVVMSRDPADSKNKYMFPIKLELQMVCFLVDGPKAVIYEWQAEGGVAIQLEFLINQEDFDDSVKFRNIIVRLLYQVATKKPFTECDNVDQIEQFCPMKDSSVVKTPKKVLAVFENLIKETSVEFSSIGELLCLKPEESDAQPILINPNFIFVLRNAGNFTYEIEIYDEDAKKVYSVAITEDLKYCVKCDTNSMSWTDVKGGKMVHLSFKFRDNQASQNLSVLMAMSVMQSSKKQKFDDIVKNSDWQQYYGAAHKEEEEVADQPEYNKYIDNRRMDIEFEKNNTFIEPSKFQDLKHSDLAQGKILDRTFVSQANNISVYQAFDDDNFNFVCNLPPVKSFTGEEINLRKLLLTEQDTKTLMLNKNADDNNIYYMDLEKGKVISELSGQKGMGVRDISHYGKNSDLTPNSVFFGCNEQNIFQMDPRMQSPVVSERPYATNYMFSTVSGAVDGSFVVGSRDGSIRMFKECAGNAKNLLPSLLGEAILHLDTSQDGSFILATCRSHIMLIPTFQDGKCGFNYMFRKENKPRPIILKVNPKSLAKLGIDRLDYSYAIFDNKKQKETLIAANAGKYLILWDLSKVLGGKHDTTTIKSLGDTIVHNEFKYNTDKLIAALPTKLICQSAKVARR